MSKEKTEYNPIDYRVDKDLKSMKAKSMQSSFVWRNFLWILFSLAFISGGLMIYYQNLYNKSKIEIGKLNQEVKKYELKVDSLEKVIRRLKK